MSIFILFFLFLRFKKALKLPSQVKNNTSEDDKNMEKNGLKSAHKSNVFIFM